MTRTDDIDGENYEMLSGLDTGQTLIPSGVCAACQSGKYKPAYGNEGCTECPADSWSVAGGVSRQDCLWCSPLFVVLPYADEGRVHDKLAHSNEPQSIWHPILHPDECLFLRILRPHPDECLLLRILRHGISRCRHSPFSCPVVAIWLETDKQSFASLVIELLAPKSFQSCRLHGIE